MEVRLYRGCILENVTVSWEEGLYPGMCDYILGGGALGGNRGQQSGAILGVNILEQYSGATLGGNTWGKN